MDKVEKIDCKLWKNDYYQGLGDDRMFDYRDKVILRYGKLIGYRKPKDRLELREKIAKADYEFDSPKAYFDWDKISDKEKGWYLRLADQILALIPDEPPKEKPLFSVGFVDE